MKDGHGRLFFFVELCYNTKGIKFAVMFTKLLKFTTSDMQARECYNVL